MEKHRRSGKQLDLDFDNVVKEDEKVILEDEKVILNGELLAVDDWLGTDAEELYQDEEEWRYDGSSDQAYGRDYGGGRREKFLTREEVDDDAASEAVERSGGEIEMGRVEVNEKGSKWDELLALPPHGSEVFISGLPRDASKEDLRVLTEPFGTIFKVKVIKDRYTNECKGFAFIMFTNGDAAQKAVEVINAKEFMGRTLRCCLSEAKHRLFINNVPRYLTEDDVREILEDCGPGIEHIQLPKDQLNRKYNRGFLFVEYYNHACAEYARQKMTNPNFMMDGINPIVIWAVDSSAAAQVRAILVKNLPENVSSERLKKLFEKNGNVTKVVLLPTKFGQGRLDVCFIHFAERSSALKAVKSTGNYEIDGHVLEVSLARHWPVKKNDDAMKSGPVPKFSKYPPRYLGNNPYWAYPPIYPGNNPYWVCRGWSDTSAFCQPKAHGGGMSMVPVVLPNGSVGYIEQPAASSSTSSSWRAFHKSGCSEGRSRDGGRKRSRYLLR